MIKPETVTTTTFTIKFTDAYYKDKQLTVSLLTHTSDQILLIGTSNDSHARISLPDKEDLNILLEQLIDALTQLYRMS